MKEGHRVPSRRIEPRSEYKISAPIDDRPYQVGDPPEVIGEISVRHYDDIAPCRFEPGEQGAPIPRTGLFDYPSTACPGDLGGGVRGTVVDHYHLAPYT